MTFACRHPFVADWRQQLLRFVPLGLGGKDNLILGIALELFEICFVIAGDGLNPRFSECIAGIALDHRARGLRQRGKFLLVHENSERNHPETNKEVSVGDPIEPEIEER